MSDELLGFTPDRIFIPAMSADLYWRRMETEDVRQVHALEAILFTSPWSKKMFLEEIAEKNYTLPIVIEHEKTIVGYLNLYIVIDEIHLANIGIVPAYQKRGIALTVLSRLLFLARENGIAVVHLEVRKSNAGAIALYKKLGFEIVGLRKNYYELEQEDALLMSCRLAETFSLNPKIG